MQRQRDTEHQRQAEEKPAQRRRGRRSWGELLAAWLLVLWGISTTILVWPLFLEFIHGESSRYDRLFPFFICMSLSQAILCTLGGLATLLRNRVLAKWALVVASLCWSVLACSNALNEQGISVGILTGCLAMLCVAALLFFLSWWLGLQEDSEA